MGWRYRIGSIAGVVVLSVLTVVTANTYPVQAVFTTYTPVFRRLDPVVLGGRGFLMAVVLTTIFVSASLVPLYKPRPMRMLDAVFSAQQRIIIAGLGLASLGYFNYTYRIPRSTLTLIMIGLVVTVPAWFVWIRERPRNGAERAVLIGDDPTQLNELVHQSNLEFLGQVSPSLVSNDGWWEQPMPDGGQQVPRLGGLSRVEEVLVRHDVDTAVLAFREADRGDFFGTLDACYEHGLDVKVHRGSTDSVLTSGEGGGLLVDVDLEPWDAQDYVVKRVFDLFFAMIGFVVLAPVMCLIAVAIKLDDGGPVLYAQDRTSNFGESITIYKFRTMFEDAEARTGATISAEDDGEIDPRVTRMGRVLRPSHLDEIPQLWTILVGKMSVVGPRPERPSLETQGFDINWRKRWFVKPGLAGLAQINDITGKEPTEKLRYDIEYIRRQSFWLDVKIVLRQFGKVGLDVTSVIKEEESRER